MLNLDDILSKNKGDATDEEKSFLEDNDQLMTPDEKKEWFSEEENKEDDQEDSKEESKSDDENTKDDDKEEESKDDKKDFSFNSEEELEAFVQKTVSAIKESEKSQEDDKGDELEEFKPFGEGYHPKWNDVAKTLFKSFKEREAKLSTHQKKQTQKELSRINDGFDNEIESLIKSGEEIPAKGTKERTEFDRTLSKVALEYNVPDMTSAYKIYKKVGVETDKSKDDSKEDKKEIKNKDNKNLAKKIGSNNSGSKSSKTKLKLNNFYSRSMDELVDEAMEKLV